jgi:hypothetical protein
MNTRPNKTQIIKRTLIAVAALGTIGAAANSYAVTGTATGTATVITPIGITKTADLDFGSFSSITDGAGGTVVIAPNGNRSATGDVALSTVGSATVSAASFNVAGQADATYAITLPESATLTNGANTMSIDTFTSSPGTSGTLDNTGKQSLAVGGTLHVGATQAAGTYAGTFNVSVEYN